MLIILRGHFVEYRSFYHEIVTATLLVVAETSEEICDQIESVSDDESHQEVYDCHFDESKEH